MYNRSIFIPSLGDNDDSRRYNFITGVVNFRNKKRREKIS